MLYEVAIVELDSLGKPTGRFEVTNQLAPDGETAKLKAYVAFVAVAPLRDMGSVRVSLRHF